MLTRRNFLKSVAMTAMGATLPRIKQTPDTLLGYPIEMVDDLPLSGREIILKPLKVPAPFLVVKVLGNVGINEVPIYTSVWIAYDSWSEVQILDAEGVCLYADCQPPWSDQPVAVKWLVHEWNGEPRHVFTELYHDGIGIAVIDPETMRVI